VAGALPDRSPILVPASGGELAGPVWRLLARARALGPGLAAVGLVALSASWLSDHYGAPALLMALLLGMAINFLSDDPRCRPGLNFATTWILRAGVALLGARITAAQIAGLGPEVLAMATLGVTVTLATGGLLARALRLDPSFGALTGGAVAICGASAALAIAALLPQSPDRARDTSLTVAGVTVLSTAAMVAYPPLAAALALDETRTGVLIGATIHDVAQVVGAGYAVSAAAGDAATIVKLFRVALLFPTLLAIAWLFRAHPARRAGGAPVLPWFLLGFAALVVARSLGAIPPPAAALASDVSGALLLMAISAVGVRTLLGDVTKVGVAALVLIAGETLALLAWTCVALSLLPF